MTGFLAFQQFTPIEQKEDVRCIWCKLGKRRNRAHIVSRKLTTTSRTSAILRYSVCEQCNSKCGETEDWILRRSPFGWLRFFYYFESNRNSNTKAIPAYFYAEDMGEWLTYRIEAQCPTRTIDTQLLLTQKDDLLFIGNKDASPQAELDAIASTVKGGRSTRDIRESLPADFSPRALLVGKNVFIIARSEADGDLIDQTIKTWNPSAEATAAKLIKPSNSGARSTAFQMVQD